MRGQNRFAEGWQRKRHRAVGVERKGCAVKDELILAAELIDIDQRQPGFGDARNDDIEADFALVAPIGRAVGHEQNFGTGLGQAFDDILVIAPVGPGIFADRQAEPHAAEADRTGQRAGGEDPLFVEHPVIRQIDLEAQRLDAAAGEQRIGIVELAVLDPVLNPWRADQHRRAAVSGFARQRLHRSAAGRLESGLEHQVFRRIAGDEQFGKGDDIAAVARRLRPRLAGKLQIAGNVADDRIELGNRDGQTVGGTVVHNQALAPERPVRQWLSHALGAAQSAATCGIGLALACRSDLNRSASRKARSSDCSALSRGSQTVW